MLAADRARLSPADVDGYRRFVDETRGDLRDGLRASSATVPFLALRRHGAVAPAADRGCASLPHRATALVSALHQATTGCARCCRSTRCWSAATRSTTTSIYALIHYLERKWGVWFATGGTGALVRGAGRRSSSALGGELRLSTDGRARSGRRRRGRRATGVRLAGGGAARRRPRGQQRRRSATPTGSCSRREHARRGTRRALDAHALLDEPVRRLLRHRPPLPDSRTTRSSSGPRYQGLLDDIFDKKRARRRLLALPAPPHASPTRRWRRPGSDAFYVLSPVPHLGSAGDRLGRKEAGATATRIFDYARADRAAGAARQARDLALHHAAALRDELRRSTAPASRSQPTLTQSAWFRPHNQYRGRGGPLLRRRAAPTRAPACPACCPRRAWSTADPAPADGGGRDRHRRLARRATPVAMQLGARCWRRRSRDRPARTSPRCRALDRASLEELLPLVAAAAPRGARTRPGRCTRSAAAPTTRSTRRGAGRSAARRARGRACAARLDARATAATSAGRAPDPDRSRLRAGRARRTASRAACPRRCSPAWRWTSRGTRYAHRGTTCSVYCFRVAAIGRADDDAA